METSGGWVGGWVDVCESDAQDETRAARLEGEPLSPPLQRETFGRHVFESIARMSRYKCRVLSVSKQVAGWELATRQRIGFFSGPL